MGTIHFTCNLQSRSIGTLGLDHQHCLKSEWYISPDPQQFFSLSAHKARFLSFPWETWLQEEQFAPFVDSIRLHLGSGFNEGTKNVLITEGTDTGDAALESTHHEADANVTLQSAYSVQNEEVDRMDIHVNDTCNCHCYMRVLNSNAAAIFI